MPRRVVAALKFQEINLAHGDYRLLAQRIDHGGCELFDARASDFINRSS